MGVEIERKFLVYGDGWREGRPIAIRQGYLCREGAVVRVRRQADRGLLTIKGPGLSLRRDEFEYEIPAPEAEELLDLCSGPAIDKTRYRIDFGGRTWEVDEFPGANEGLIVAEVEIESEAAEVELPPWVGKEVSTDPRYRNSNLAATPYSTWRDLA